MASKRIRWKGHLGRCNGEWVAIVVERATKTPVKKRRIKTKKGWATVNAVRMKFVLGWNGERFSQGSELEAIRRYPAALKVAERLARQCDYLW